MTVESTTIGDAPQQLIATAIHVTLGGRAVVRDVNLTVRAGQRVALVGPNGSGKSTVLRACAGILPLSAGSVRLDNSSIHAVKRRTLSRLIGLMPQQTDMQFPLSCVEAVLLGRSPHKRGLGLADDDDMTMAEEAMSRLGVWQLAKRPVTAVSGGELQRLMFARVLVQRCRFVLLDEPTSAQDPAGILRMQEVLKELSRSGVGVLAAVHDLNLALRFFQKVVVLARGTVVQQGAPHAVLENGALESAFGVRLRLIDDGGLPLVVPESAQDDTHSEILNE